MSEDPSSTSDHPRPAEPDATTAATEPPWEPSEDHGSGSTAEEGWAAEFDEAPKEDSLLPPEEHTTTD